MEISGRDKLTVQAWVRLPDWIFDLLLSVNLMLNRKISVLILLLLL
jgi:hypothetical protein